MADAVPSTLTYGKRYCHSHLHPSALAFKEHQQFPTMIHTLMRKMVHHICFRSSYITQLTSIFCQAFYIYLQEVPLPALRNAVAIEYDLSLLYTPSQKKELKNELLHIGTTTRESSFLTLLFFQVPSLQDLIRDECASTLYWLSQQPNLRVVLFVSPGEDIPAFLTKDFCSITLPAPNANDHLMLLRYQRTELEQYHHVVISDELITQAIHYAKRYLSPRCIYEKAILLLDSACAATLKKSPKPSIEAPVVEPIALIEVLSASLQIPQTKLNPPFNKEEMGTSLQQKLFGQDLAIEVLTQAYKQAHAQLATKCGPFCSLLLIGPRHAGKKTATRAIASYLFGRTNIVYLVQPDPSAHLLDLQACAYGGETAMATLAELVTEQPFAIFLFASIENFSERNQYELQSLLTLGSLQLRDKPFDFSQSTIIFTLELEAPILNPPTLPTSPKEDFNLVQFLACEQKRSPKVSTLPSTLDITKALIPELNKKIPFTFYQHTTIVPFLSLSTEAIEKMIRSKLKILGKHLEARYQVELGYAAEVIPYLIRDVLQQSHCFDVAAAMQPLYLCIEQALQNRAIQQKGPNQLFLQLNETGQLLRCEWLMLRSERQHAH